MRLLSLGAGVQSTTLALMACNGHLESIDGAIFADTGWEPQRVYDHLGRLAAEVLTPAGVPLYRVSAGNLRHDSINPGHRYASIPYFVRNPDGSEGMGRRQCTSEYKLAPIRRKVRELLGAPPPDFKRVPRGRVVEEWVGFSADEIGRVNDNAPLYLRTRYPLIERGMDRRACERYLADRGWGAVSKSACIGCPYHGNAQWRNLRDNHPAEWADAVAFDEAIRKGGARGLPLNGEAFLHRSRVPLALAPINRTTRGERLGWQTDIYDYLDPAVDFDGDAACQCGHLRREHQGLGVPLPADRPCRAKDGGGGECGCCDFTHLGWPEDQKAHDEAEDGDPDGCSPYGCRSGAAVSP